MTTVDGDAVLASPVFVIGPPGSAQETMLASLLLAPGTWPAGSELGDVLVDLEDPTGGREQVRSALADGYARLDRSSVPPGVTSTMVAAFSQGGPSAAVLDAVFPDARFVLLVHEPVLAVSSLLAATPDRDAGGLVDVWGAGLADMLDALEVLDPSRWTTVAVPDLVREPEAEVQRVFAFLGLGWHQHSSQPWRELPPVRIAKEVAEPVAGLRPVMDRLRSTIESAPPSLLPSTPAGALSATDNGFAALLGSLGSSLVVSTYQTNRLVVLRRDEGRLGVHLRAFDRPMGIAVSGDSLAVGVRAEILDHRNFPQVAPSLEPKGRHDAAFLPRNTHYTGDIAVHDLEFGRDGLWLVATAFNCLATLDADHSFVPRWRPDFITEMVAEDRCHLNGLALVDGLPRYVTALGVSDTAGGWRADKSSGGVIIDVTTNELVASGLSMPHSPRWHDGRLWFLESGKGHLSVCDPGTGKVDVVAELPGFTRGLSFSGSVAFVGTSQIRETATFGGLPVSSLPDRACGVWAIDLRDGRRLASVVFEDRIQELFDLAVLEGVRFPEIAEPSSELARTTWLLPTQ